MPATSSSSKVGNAGSTETIKRLIRSASELVKKLDLAFTKVKSCKDLFTPELIELRQHLSQLCSKSLAADPLQCRRKAEELLWRKCYYNVISTAKIHSKKSQLSAQEVFYLELHIDSGVARLMEHLLDATLRLNCTKLPSGISSLLHYQPLDHNPLTSNRTLVESNESTEVLLESAQRILVWLGDLSRYKIDLGLSTDTVMAQRFYQQASVIRPSNGLPYNQLGTLLSHQPKKEVESIALYLRSMLAPEPFAGAGPNLQQLLERIAASSCDDLKNLSRLITGLVLQPLEDVAELGHLCQLVIASAQQKLQSDDSISPELVDLAAVVVLLSESKSASGTEAAAALGCSLLSLVMAKCHQALNLDQDKVKAQDVAEKKEGDDEEEEEVDELKRARIRRRKAQLSDSSNSDVEEAFSDYDDDLFSDEDESDGSDGGSGNESCEEKRPTENEKDVANPEIPPPVQEILLPILIVLTNWLRADKQIVAISAQSARSLWSLMAMVLNELARAKRLEKIDSFERHALPEDWRFHGLPKRNSDDFDFSLANRHIDLATATAVRVDRLLRFGHWLISEAPETGFKHENEMFVCDSNVDAAESQNKKDAMMRNMATLWLKSEVQDLEEKLGGGKKVKKNQTRNLKSGKQQLNRNRKMSASELLHLPYVYVVVDVVALTEYQPLIKRFVKSQKCIIVVPSVVLSELDQLKKENSFVRDCIRWLEACFRSGNRFLRGQRQNEHKTIPLMTYPKRKDKANWSMFQILECCHYLDSQQREVYRNVQDTPIVLLLSGQFRESQDQQIQGICQSIGVDIKSPESMSFPAKYKQGNIKSSLQEMM